MTPERWDQVKDLFRTALEREPAGRDAFLAEACVGDPALRSELESLISSHEEAEDFLEAAAGEIPIKAIAEEEGDEGESMAGRRIGPYELLREIGRGGMGAVYLADRVDGHYRKKVAIKLVKRGMDTDSILRRFRNERQILAGLDHPNIARLLDGGTTEEGLPYFVMEYVAGKPLYEYCDAQSLPTTDRLALFRTVCSAVQYAHQNLIVHRDLKPSNILVTAQGVPKLLDFGIAKLLNPELSSEIVDATATALRLMTPDYASPEQAKGEPITTASDIYSLGVLLYELLTGHPPYRFKSRQPQEILEAVCLQEPEKPSTAVTRVEEVFEPSGKGSAKVTPESVGQARNESAKGLRRKLAGDLDNIVLKALRKEPQRRYGSVEQFSEDIQRYLQRRPVIARKDSFRYRAGKFIRRNKAAVGAATLIFLSLVAGISATAWQAQVAKAQKARAERRFNDVRSLANSVVFELHDAIEKLPGSTKARELLVERALQYLDSLAQEAADDPSLQRELAAAYEKIGAVQGRIGASNLGNTADALASYRKALGIHQLLLSKEPTNPDLREDLARSNDGIGLILQDTGDMPGALRHYRRSLELRQERLASRPRDLSARAAVAKSFFDIGRIFSEGPDFRAALENYQKAREIQEELLKADPNGADNRRNLALTYKYLGGALEFLRKPESAREFYPKAIALDEARLKANLMNTQAQLDLSFSYGAMGACLQTLGELADALHNYRKALELRKAVSAADPNDVWARGAVARAHDRIGQILEAAGDKPGALDSLRKTLAIRESLPKPDAKRTAAWTDLASCYTRAGNLSSALASNPRAVTRKRVQLWREARSFYQKSLQIWLDMRTRGALPAAQASRPEETTRYIALCNTALSKLQRPREGP